MRSSRAGRSSLAQWSAALMLGVMLFLLGGSGRLDFVSPGPLHFKHGALGDCTVCHRAAEDGPLGWMRLALATRAPESDGERCLACHVLGPEPYLPHSSPPGRLGGAARGGGGVPVRLELAALLAGGPGAGARLGCAACHREHQGRTASLTALDDEQCQVCHAGAFRRFDSGHPPFARFPYERRTRLVFDHARHRDDHFARKATAFACEGCHAPDSAGRHMLLGTFDQACASCHEAKVRRGESPVLTIPVLDLDTLRARQVPIGGWPHGDGARSFSPYLRVLLASEPDAEAALSMLEPLERDGSLEDLTDASDEQLRAVGVVVWALKRLLRDLAENGHSAITSRVRRRLGDVSAGEPAWLGRLAGGLPSGVLHDAVQAWFPDLVEELDERESGAAPATVAVVLAEDVLRFDWDPNQWASGGGWRRAEDGIVYRSRGHADPYLRAWLDLAARLESGATFDEGFSPLGALSAGGATASCVKCHSVERAARPDTGVTVNWRAASEVVDGAARTFTRYAHEPHFSLGSREGCDSCHELAPASDYLESYRELDPRRFQSNFEPLSTETCARCHRRAAAATGCTTCHVYHADDGGPPAADTDPPARASGRRPVALSGHPRGG